MRSSNCIALLLASVVGCGPAREEASGDAVESLSTVSQGLDWSIVTTGASWSPSWSGVMPFTINQQPYVMVYMPGGYLDAGVVRFDRFRPDGFGTINLRQTTLSVGSNPSVSPVTTFMPYYVGGVPHFIAYSRYTGDVMFARINGDGSNYTVLSRSVWGTGWTNLVSYTLFGEPFFIAYNATTGQVHFDKISADGAGFSILATNTWATGWSRLTALQIGGMPYLVAHNPTSALTHIDFIYANGSGASTLNSFYWRGDNTGFSNGYQDLSAFEQGGKSYLMGSWGISDSNFNSQYEILEVEASGETTSLGKAYWDGRFDFAEPYKLGSQNFFIAYSSLTGQAYFDKLTFTTAPTPTPPSNTPWIWATQVDNAQPWGWTIRGAGFKPNFPVSITVTIGAATSTYYDATNGLGTFDDTIVNLGCLSPNSATWTVSDGTSTITSHVRCTAL